MRVVFMGTSPFGVPAMRTIHEGPHELVAAFSQPPRPAGRGHKVHKTAIHEAAEALGIPVHTPASLRNDEAVALLRSLEADLAVVAAYGLILPRSILETPRLGAINLHGSILPRWRGAAPIQRAILAGDRETGVAIFQMEEGLDTGPVYAEEHVAIGPRTTASELHDELSEIAAKMMPEVLDGLAAGTLEATPQPDEGAIYAHKITKDDGRLDFSEPAVMIERRLRALNPWPGCFCHAGDERLTLIEGEVVDGEVIDGGGRPGEIIELPMTIACGEGAIRITTLKRAGKRAMDAEAFQRGAQLPAGTILG
jgi:methionyl-tRNA formyltransferase